MISSRDVGASKDRGARGVIPSARDWVAAQSEKGSDGAAAGSFAAAAAFGELLINATSGMSSLDALGAAESGDIEGKILIDIANPLDFSSGVLTLAFCNTESLGERIQRAYPGARVVKTLNTVNAGVMIAPQALPEETDMFVAGDDAAAKAWVTDEVLKGWFGWRRVTDLGDITGSRALEMYMPLWMRCVTAIGTPALNMRVVKAAG
jgi:predicted dinucleotide-binding enzyme